MPDTMNIIQSLAWLESFCGPFGPGDGVPDSELDRAAKRLGCELPRALREYYRRAGRSPALSGRIHRFLAPKQFKLEGQHLIYCREKRGGVHWAVPQSQFDVDDPVVELGYRRAAQDSWQYAAQFPSVSVASRAMGAWEAVQGSLPFVGVVRLAGSQAKFREPPSEALGVELKAMRAWLVPDGVVVESDGEIYLATRGAESYRRAGALIGIDDGQWDYATIVDGE